MERSSTAQHCALFNLSLFTNKCNIFNLEIVTYFRLFKGREGILKSSDELVVAVRKCQIIVIHLEVHNKKKIDNLFRGYN